MAGPKDQEPDDDGPPYDCPGCQGGDKWPVDEPVWRCPVCDTEYWDDDAENGGK
jgi:hypothetical protein